MSLSETPGQCAIICGSQTGTAFDLAGFFSYEASLRGLSTKIYDPPSYPLSQLPRERTCVFLFIATTGQGEATSNIKTFWNFLRRTDLPANSLVGVQFAIFGLGDSSYPRYTKLCHLVSLSYYNRLI